MNKIPSETLLQAIEVFRDLDGEQRRAVADGMSIRRYHAKQIIISRNEPSTDVYFVISGTVKATVYSTGGKEVTFQELGPGEMFGELAAIDGESRSAYVETKTEATIAGIPEQKFWAALADYPEVRKAILRRLARLSRFLCEKIVLITTLPVNERIRTELVRMANAVSDGGTRVEIPDPPTHSEMACLLGTHREAVTKELKRLEKDGLIDWRPGNHVILDLPALRGLCGESGT